MDALPVTRKHTAGRTAPRRAAQRGNAAERRRLAQLLVSLALFLLVFFGRGIFPAGLDQLSALVRTDTDFTAVFRQLGQTLPKGEWIGQLFSQWVELTPDFPGELGDEPEQTQQPAGLPVPLTAGRRLGLVDSAQYGLRPAYSMEEIASKISALPESSAEPQIVTAVAQVYAEDGTKLPSNVSFFYYELGLERTAVPVMGEVSSGFGYRISPLSGKREFHLALDIAADEGTKIGAFSDGVVEYIGESKDFGLYLKINHANGVSSFYAHCSKLLVRKGEQVTCGQTVALVGSTGDTTGSHLHLTILKDNIRLNPAYYVAL